MPHNTINALFGTDLQDPDAVGETEYRLAVTYVADLLNDMEEGTPLSDIEGLVLSGLDTLVESAALLSAKIRSSIRKNTKCDPNTPIKLIVRRASYGDRTAVVYASSLAEADEIALAHAGDFDYSEKDYDYEVRD